MVAKPSALLFAPWLGQEGICYFAEREFGEVIDEGLVFCHQLLPPPPPNPPPDDPPPENPPLLQPPPDPLPLDRGGIYMERCMAVEELFRDETRRAVDRGSEPPERYHSGGAS